jgi:hypothetical protein
MRFAQTAPRARDTKTESFSTSIENGITAVWGHNNVRPLMLGWISFQQEFPKQGRSFFKWGFEIESHIHTTPQVCVNCMQVIGAVSRIAPTMSGDTASIHNQQ